MLAFSAFAESPFSSLGGTVRFGSTTQEAIFSKVSAGVGTFTGEADVNLDIYLKVIDSNGDVDDTKTQEDCQDYIELKQDEAETV